MGVGIRAALGCSKAFFFLTILTPGQPITKCTLGCWLGEREEKVGRLVGCGCHPVKERREQQLSEQADCGCLIKNDCEMKRRMRGGGGGNVPTNVANVNLVTGCPDARAGVKIVGGGGGGGGGVKKKKF